MKIKINSIVLKNSIKKVSLGVAKKSKLPIIENILLEATESGVTLTSNSLSHGIKVEIENTDCTIIEPGSIIINATDFKLLEKLKDEIEISTDNNNNIVYKANRTLSSMIKHEAPDFPTFPKNEFAELFIIPAIEFKANCKIKKMVAKESTRPMLTGLAIYEDYMVTCDGYRIARIKLDIDNNKKFIIPIETITLIEKIIDKKDDSNLNFSISDDEKNLLIKNKEFTIFTSLIEGDYLKVEQSYPNESDISISVNRKEFIDYLDFAIQLNTSASKKSQVELYLDSNSNKIEFISKVEGRIAKEEIEMLAHARIKDDFKIAFNPKYMIEALKMLEADKINIDFISKLAPMILSDSTNKEQHLILPVRVTEWARNNEIKKTA